MAELRLDEVRKVYENGHVAVEGATFEAGDGELLVLVGPSGCGKSTLLRLIAGLESISSGNLIIDGRVVNERTPKERDIAMVFQSYALYPHMTVAENLAFGLKLRKRPAEEIRRRVRETAQTLGLTALLDRRPALLSGGQRQRVALGRALVRDPRIFLLDEPLSNLDAALRLSMRTEIARLQRGLRATMVYVTHDQLEAMTLGHRIVVLNAGRIQQIDAPMRLYQRPANLFVAGFFGSPAMNFLRGRLLEDGMLRLDAGGVIDLRQAAAVHGALAARRGGEIVIGVRPEDIRPLDESSDAGEGAAFVAQLDFVEPVGNEAFLNLSFEGTQLVARVPPHDPPRAGAALHVGFAPRAMHCFDAVSGLRLGD